MVLIYLLSLSGGAGRNAVYYANILNGAGHKVYLICGIKKERNLEYELDKRVHLASLESQRSFLTVYGLIKKIRIFEPSQILVIGLSNMLPVLVAAKFTRFKGRMIQRISSSPSGMQTTYPRYLRWIKSTVFKLGFFRADIIIALTRAMEEELVRVWSVPAVKISYIPNGIIIREESPVRRPQRPPIILCVARLAPEKNHALLLRAFSMLRVRRDCCLHLAGDGPLREKLQTLATELGVAEDVVFHGHIGCVGAAFSTASFVVLSSRREGFPNVLIEAMASGCPVVATDCPTGPREIINSQKVGLLAQIDDHEDLAIKMEQALLRGFDVNNLVERAEHYSYERMAEGVRYLFRPSSS